MAPSLVMVACMSDIGYCRSVGGMTSLEWQILTAICIVDLMNAVHKVLNSCQQLQLNLFVVYYLASSDGN